jgi:hypothetical protein
LEALRNAGIPAQAFFTGIPAQLNLAVIRIRLFATLSCLVGCDFRSHCRPEDDDSQSPKEENQQCRVLQTSAESIMFLPYLMEQGIFLACYPNRSKRYLQNQTSWNTISGKI